MTERMKLDRLDIAMFLQEYWQKKPLRIANPWKLWRNPLDADELAGLACDEGSEARIVTLTSDTWNVEHGPFNEARFAVAGDQPWTLLVQAVDHRVPAVAALIAPFCFVPNWRIDDVMVSYATDGGGVGPHYDQYDVFLIQGSGRRRWQVGELCDQATALLPHDDLRLLADFQATDEWLLEPGDVLYLPPRIAHNGIAIGDDCMTYSIGFRAPSRSELIAHWCDHLLANLTDDDRYDDPKLPAQINPGEITATAVTRLHAMVVEKMLDRDAFARWFGQYNSTPKYHEVIEQAAEPVQIDILHRLIASHVPVIRNPASRFSFIRQTADAVWLFVDGACLECIGANAALAEQFCAQDRIVIEPKLIGCEPAMALLSRLVAHGSIAFDEED